MDRIKAKNIIKEERDRSAQDFDNRAGHGIRTKEEGEVWRNLLTRAIGTNRLKILDVVVNRHLLWTMKNLRKQSANGFGF
jgi:hypothetical protein